jgi:hypothetical protein
VNKHTNYLLFTTFIGFGDLLYHTPVIRYLKKKGYDCDVWCKNLEPFMWNSDIRSLYFVTDNITPVPSRFYATCNAILPPEPHAVKAHHPATHVTDYVSLNMFGMVLPNKDKQIVLNVPAHVRDGFITKFGLSFKLMYRKIMVLPVVKTWPSRTLSKEWLEYVIELAQSLYYTVVLVGRDFAPTDVGSNNPYLEATEQKNTIDISTSRPVIDLRNKLTLHELAYLYSIADVAVIGENGHLPIAGSTNCHIIYVAQLLPPEYRLPWRQGSQSHKTTVLHADRYPSEENFFGEPMDLTKAPTYPAHPNEVYKALEDLLQ